MQAIQFEIQFLGEQSDAVQILSRYFGKAANGDAVTDQFDREWAIRKHDDGVRNILATPPLYVLSDVGDAVLLHDVLLLFRMSASFTFDRTCGMNIVVPTPKDERKLGMYYEMYVSNQFDQIDEFSAGAITSPMGEVRPYLYDVCGFEIDNINDILLIIMANYGDNISDFTLDFSRVISDHVLVFKAFNGSFDDNYALRAASWVHDFIACCNDLWSDGGYGKEYDRLRTVYSSY